MSINSWKAEFYKGRVKHAARNAVSATEHSIVKWTGLSPENLKKHGLIQSDDMLINEATQGMFQVGVSECALCEYDTDMCSMCPLDAVGAGCSERNSPYHVWWQTGDNKPMMKALQKALKYAKRQAGIE